MSEISINQARLEDAAAILELQKLAYQAEAALYNDWTIPPLTQTLSRLEAEFDTHLILKAVAETRIVGSIRARLEGGTCLIGRLVVHPEFQKRGIGTRLLDRVETLFRTAERFELFTGSRSLDNIRLYEKCGYHIFKEEDLSTAVRLVYMEKTGKSLKASLAKIVSGGQTGADRAALDFALLRGIPHGGWIPKGRRTEKGPLPERYNLLEMPTLSYPQRTEQNVLDSDGTLIVSHGPLKGGSALTRRFAEIHGKPCLHVDLTKPPRDEAALRVREWIGANAIKVLNVAGPRGSEDPEIYEETLRLLIESIETYP